MNNPYSNAYKVECHSPNNMRLCGKWENIYTDTTFVQRLDMYIFLMVSFKNIVLLSSGISEQIGPIGLKIIS